MSLNVLFALLFQRQAKLKFHRECNARSPTGLGLKSRFQQCVARSRSTYNTVHP